MELLVIMNTIFARSHMWFKHGEKLEHIVAKYLSVDEECFVPGLSPPGYDVAH